MTSKKQKLAAWRLLDVSQLAEFGPVQVSTQAHGECLQYSVFLCDPTVAGLVELQSAVTGVMNLYEDSVVQIDLGSLHAPAVRTLGCSQRLPATDPRIV